MDGERIAPGASVTLHDGASVVFGQCILQFVLRKIIPGAGSRERRAERKKRAAEDVSNQQSPRSCLVKQRSLSPTRGASGSPSRKQGLKKQRRGGSDAAPSKPTECHDQPHAASTSPQYSTSSGSSGTPVPALKAVRWSPDMVRVHEVPTTDYPPDFYEATMHSVIMRNMIAAAVGESDEEDAAAEEPSLEQQAETSSSAQDNTQPAPDAENGDVAVV